MSATDWLEKRNDPDPEWKWSHTTQPAEIFFKKFHTSNTDLILGICVQCWSAKIKKLIEACFADRAKGGQGKGQKGKKQKKKEQAEAAPVKVKQSAVVPDLGALCIWTLIGSCFTLMVCTDCCILVVISDSQLKSVICWVLSEWPIGI